MLRRSQAQSAATSERGRWEPSAGMFCARHFTSGPGRPGRLIPVNGWLELSLPDDQGGTAEKSFAPELAGIFFFEEDENGG